MAAQANGPPILGVSAIKPEEHHGWEGFKFFCYNKRAGTIMGRTPRSWALITLFYIIYYACLAAFWALMLYIFLTTIDDKRPKYLGDDSVIGSSPGLGMRPTQPDDTISSSMIIFNKDSEHSTKDVPGWGHWNERINMFLAYYDNSGRICTKIHPATEEEACRFRRSNLGPCSTGTYGYSDGMPCIYFKLNRIYGVNNDHYHGHGDIHPDMPDELKHHIDNQTDKDQVWVNCRGENPADTESMGELKYYPASRGLPSMYFPYMRQKGYRSPVVAVQFLNPPVGQLVHVECRAWAKNIGYDRTDRIGMAHFELLVLDDNSGRKFQESFN